jgi:hypothetical protein
MEQLNFKAPALEDGEIHLFGAEAISKYLLGNDSKYLPQVYLMSTLNHQLKLFLHFAIESRIGPVDQLV